MKKWFVLSSILFLAAIALLIISVITGESEFGLFIIFPFIVGAGPIAAIGAILLLVAILLAFIAFASRVPQEKSMVIQSPQSQEGSSVDRKFGAVVMVGPIPIAFGTDKKIAWIMALIGFAMVIVVVLALVLSIFV